MKKHSALDFLKKSEWSHESRYFENTLQKDEASQICAHCPNCHKNNIQTAQNREKGLSQEASCSSGRLRESVCPEPDGGWLSSVRGAPVRT